MKKQIKNSLIGVFVLVACFLVIAIILFLKPSIGDGKQTFYVRFSNINQINIGTRVTFAGKPVGEVISIEEIPDARDQPADPLGRVYFYQLTIKVDSSVSIYNTDTVTLQTSGLLGEKSIAIIPKTPPPGVVQKKITNQPIYADSIDPIENTFEEISELSSKLESTIEQISIWIRENSDDISYGIKKFGESMEQISIAVTSINEDNLMGEVSQTVRNINDTVVDMQCILHEMEENKTFVNLARAMNNINKATANIENITQDIESGRGTLGKLIEDDELYLRTNAILSKVDTTMNDINHYGILFHLNKGWQRTRLQRINLLNALDTPSGFKTYFEQEIDDINTSMARLSMLLEKAEDSPKRAEILQSTPFKRDFVELLNQVNELSDNLKLYNEQLASPDHSQK